MKQPIIIDREKPSLTRFYCLTCGEKMHRCATCSRYLCKCANKEWQRRTAERIEHMRKTGMLDIEDEM